MNARIALLAFPLIALAQAPPPDVDRALRARANEFFGYYVDGSFRKAFDLVAEDTKDAYFNTAKQRIKSFELGEIKYSDNFTKAVIIVKAKRDMLIEGQAVPTDLSEEEKFKIEDGKWVWYDVLTGDLITPASVGRVDPTAPVSKGRAPQLPTDLSPEALQAMASRLLQQSSLDKSEVSLATNKTSEDKVVFHNGMAGPVQIQLAQFGSIPGFSAKLDKTQVDGSQNAALLLRYEPGDQKPSVTQVDLRLVVSPTNQAFTVTVKLTGAQ
jgi:hypothetical protein